MKNIRGRKLPLTAAGLQALRGEPARSIEPARVPSAEALGLERTLAHLVNQAYAPPDQVIDILSASRQNSLTMPFSPRYPPAGRAVLRGIGLHCKTGV